MSKPAHLLGVAFHDDDGKPVYSLSSSTPAQIMAYLLAVAQVHMEQNSTVMLDPVYAFHMSTELAMGVRYLDAALRNTYHRSVAPDIGAPVVFVDLYPRVDPGPMAVKPQPGDCALMVDVRNPAARRGVNIGLPASWFNPDGVFIGPPDAMGALIDRAAVSLREALGIMEPDVPIAGQL